MAGRALAQRFAGQSFIEIAIVLPVVGWCSCGDGNTQQFSAQSKLGVAIMVSEEPVVPDSLKPMRQNME
jgi:hypothetical protein